MDLLMWQMRKNCSLFITSGTLSQLTGNTSICNTSKIDFRRLEALFCGVWPSPDFSLLSSRISLQNREKCRFEPTFKKACPARLSERKSLISSGFRRVRGLQKRPQNGHPRHSCIKDSDFTKFKVTTTSSELNLAESFSVLAFYMYGGMYNVFNGTEVENIAVDFINEATGQIMNSANSRDMGE